MAMVWSAFSLPKDLESPDAYEDAYEVNESTGIAAIADGVSSAIFSRDWANVFTKAVATNPPEPACLDTFNSWLVERRKEWEALLNAKKIGLFQKLKLEQVGGAYTTVLWIEFSTQPENSEHDFTTFNVQARALGDCCLFHIRDGILLSSFPLTSVKDFGLHPNSIGSRASKNDHACQFLSWDSEAQEGDLLALTTDAFAEWLFLQISENKVIDWESYWKTTEADWYSIIQGLRENNEIRYDDTTLVLIRLVKDEVQQTADKDDNELDGNIPSVLEHTEQHLLSEDGLESSENLDHLERADDTINEL